MIHTHPRTTMTKIKVVSDLHLECCEHGHGIPDLGKGEVLILGGDILCARHFKKNGPLKSDLYPTFSINAYKTLMRFCILQEITKHMDTTMRELGMFLQSIYQREFIFLKMTS
jgi:hypothetical protein